MKSTINLSRSIEAQQRRIINSRKTMDTDADQDQDADADADQDQDQDQDKDQDQDQDQVDNENKNNNQITPSTANSDTSNSLHSSISPGGFSKRLKRNKAPPPLNLGLAQQSVRPAIKSAPLFNPLNNYNYNYNNSNTPATARRVQFQRRVPPNVPTPNRQIPSNNVIMTPNGPARIIPYLAGNDPKRQQQQQQPQQHVAYTPGFRPLQKPVVPIPKTATTYRSQASYRNNGIPLTQHQLAKYQQQLAYQQEQWAKFKEYRESNKVSHVADIFEGDATRLAPVTSQPLSAQRAFFNLDSAGQHVVAATTATKKAKAEGSRITEEDEEEAEEGEEAEDDEEEEDPEANAIEENAVVEGESSRPSEPLKTELRISDSVFRFEFQKLESSEQSDKERFLSHCAAAWDHFTNLQ
jgi:down-regulator of invasive growth 2